LLAAEVLQPVILLRLRMLLLSLLLLLLRLPFLRTLVRGASAAVHNANLDST